MANSDDAKTAQTTDAVLTTSEVADRFGVSRATVLRWAAAGRIPSRRLGPKTIRFRAADVDAFEAAS